MVNAIRKSLRVSAASALVLGGLLGGTGAAGAFAAAPAPAPEVVGATQTEYFDTPGACNTRVYELRKYYARVQACSFNSTINRWYLTYNQT